MTNTYGCPFCGDPDYVGHEVLGVYDGVLYWVCTKCNYAWPRFTDKRQRLSQLSKEYADEHNERHRDEVHRGTERGPAGSGVDEEESRDAARETG